MTLFYSQRRVIQLESKGCQLLFHIHRRQPPAACCSAIGCCVAESFVFVYGSVVRLQLCIYTAAGEGGECICVCFLWTYLSGRRSIFEYNVDQLGDDKDASPGGARCLDIFLILVLNKIVLGASTEK